MGRVGVCALLVFNFFFVVLPILIVLFQLLLTLLFVSAFATIMRQISRGGTSARPCDPHPQEAGDAPAEAGEASAAAGGASAEAGGACGRRSASRCGVELVDGEKSLQALQHLLDVYRCAFCMQRTVGRLRSESVKEERVGHLDVASVAASRDEHPFYSSDESPSGETSSSSVLRLHSQGQSPLTALLPSEESLLPLILPPKKGEEAESEVQSRLRLRKQTVFEKLHAVLLGLPPPIVVSVEPPEFALPLDALLFSPTSAHTHLRFPRADGHPLLLRQIFLHVPLSRREQRWIDALHSEMKKQFRPPLSETSARDMLKSDAWKREDAAELVPRDGADELEALLLLAESDNLERESEKEAGKSRGGSRSKKPEKTSSPSRYPTVLEPVLLRVLWLMYRNQSRKFPPPSPPVEICGRRASSRLGSLSTRASFHGSSEGSTEGSAEGRPSSGRASRGASGKRLSFLEGEEETEQETARALHADEKDEKGRFLDSGMTEEEEQEEAEELAKAAAQHVGKMVAFRREMFPLADTDPNLKEDLEKGVLYWCGRGSGMRPLLVLSLQRLDAPLLDLPRFLRLLIFVFEWGLRFLMVPGKVETCLVLLDLREVSLWKLPYACMQTLVQTLTVQYPFRLRKMFVLHNSRLIDGLWSVAKGFLTDVQQAKIATFKVDRDKNSLELTRELGKLVPASQLERKFGGERPDAVRFYPFPIATPEPLPRKTKAGTAEKVLVDKPMPGCWKAADLVTAFGAIWEADCRVPVQWRSSAAAAILRDPLSRRQIHPRRLSSVASSGEAGPAGDSSH
uniref:CRAL/TRIO domain-containing protein n=1 Tax=Toxoplasma gondii COUG TaxID=1074873 RepID=A0A2G8XTC0_TOXGO|nr:CRAL/TRIO domain-containing protein [Toxoplasma gondii COUG]